MVLYYSSTCCDFETNELFATKNTPLQFLGKVRLNMAQLTQLQSMFHLVSKLKNTAVFNLELVFEPVQQNTI